MNITLAWWNTSLSPTKNLRDQASPDERHLVAALSRLLIDNYGLDALALCEVSAGDIEVIEASCDLEAFEVVPILSDAGRGVFDMCVFIRKNTLAIQSSVSVVTLKGTRTSRIAQHLTLSVATEQKPIHLFLSHWTSRKTLQQLNPDRSLLGTRLRDAAVKLLADDKSASIIFAGDYNDEPFDVSLADSLLATRDKELVKRKQHLFYNPFWRHLTAYSHEMESSGHSDRGSYFHIGGDATRWRTFDQMIFSAAFVSGGPWMLNETATRVVQMREFSDLVTSRLSRIDHLPVVGQIHKMEPVND